MMCVLTGDQSACYASSGEGLSSKGPCFVKGLSLLACASKREGFHSRSDLGCQTVAYNLDRSLVAIYTRLPVSISSHRTGRLRGRYSVLAWRLEFSDSGIVYRLFRLIWVRGEAMVSSVIQGRLQLKYC